MSAAASAVDPKFVPSAASLRIVDIPVNAIRTDEALIAFVKDLQKKRELTDAQEAVAVYTARKRGHEYPWILTEFKIGETTAKQREKEGMAILRLGEITRTVDAIRRGELGVKVVDEITARIKSLGENDVDQRILDLEVMAAGKAIQKKYTNADKTALSNKQVADIVKKATLQVGEKVEPLSATSIVNAVPSFSEESGLVVKVEPRTPGEQKQGPMGLEFHLRAALKDIAALEKAAEEAYSLTTHDYKALFDLVTRFGLQLEPTEDLVKALAVAEKAGL